MRIIRGFVSRLSGKLVFEVLPVALASVIGTLIINHYGVRLVSPVVVESPPPPAGADALLEALRDERQLVVDYLKRDADAAASSKVEKAAIDPPPPPARERPAKVRLAAFEKPQVVAAAPTAAPKSEPALAPGLDEDRPGYDDILSPPAEPRGHGMFDRVRASVGALVHLPERALAFRFPGDDRPSPPELIPQARADAGP
jgi:hypothetical protein